MGLIHSISLSFVAGRWFWSLSGMEDYLVRSTRSYIVGIYLPASNVPTRWIRLVPIKINVFSWRLSLDKHPTIATLDNRGLDVPSLLCPLYEIY